MIIRGGGTRLLSERLRRIQERLLKGGVGGSYAFSRVLDKYALAWGGYSHWWPGEGILTNAPEDGVEVGYQEPAAKVDYPFPGKLPSQEKGVSYDPENWAEDASAFLDQQPIEIFPDELLVGTYHWNFWDVRKREFKINQERLAFLLQRARELGADGMGWSKVQVDLRIGLSLGWGGILQKIRKYRDVFKSMNKEKEVSYLNAMEKVCLAIMRYIRRYGEKAEELAKKEGDSLRKKCYSRVAQVCKKISNNPPSSFHEALQWVVFYAILEKMLDGPCGGYGRLDYVLYPFYKKDVDEGNITRDEAKELLQEFLLKYNIQFGLGGRDENLKDATNDLTFLFLEAYRDVRSPAYLGLMIHKDMDPKIIDLACQILLECRTSIPPLLNYDVMYQSEINSGISPEDAWYVSWNACPWYSVPGMEYGCGDMAGINLLKVFMNAFNLAVKIPVQTYEELWNIYCIYVEEAIKALKELTDELWKLYPKVWPEILPSMMTYGCIENGKDITEFGAKYNILNIQIPGVANVADCLAAIKKRVFEEKKTTLTELKKAVDANWEGYENLRQLMLTAPKFGNDDDYVDQIAVEVVNQFKRTLKKYRNFRGDPYRVGAIWCHQGYLYAGQLIGATPDGRKAEEPIAQNASPMNERARNGVTALLRSVSKLPFDQMLGGPVQLELDAGSIKNKEVLKSLALAFFNSGGVHLNINILSLEDLKAAMKNPEKYKHIVIRVTGYAARFVDLTREEQEAVIARYRYKNL